MFGYYFEVTTSFKNMVPDYFAVSYTHLISVLETAGEGGPWGMALLAAYMNGREEGQSLQDYLASRIFKNSHSVTVSPLETCLLYTSRCV